MHLCCPLPSATKQQGLKPGARTWIPQCLKTPPCTSVCWLCRIPRTHDVEVTGIGACGTCPVCTSESQRCCDPSHHLHHTRDTSHLCWRWANTPQALQMTHSWILHFAHSLSLMQSLSSSTCFESSLSRCRRIREIHKAARHRELGRVPVAGWDSTSPTELPWVRLVVPQHLCWVLSQSSCICYFIPGHLCYIFVIVT